MEGGQRCVGGRSVTPLEHIIERARQLEVVDVGMAYRYLLAVLREANGEDVDHPNG